MSTGERPESHKAFRSSASRLKQEREERGWTQTELAERIGTTQVNVSRWETGQTMPGPYNRQKLADLFKKSLRELGLLSETDEGSSEEVFSSIPVVDSPLPTTHFLHSNVPYRRNPYFTGRKIILERLHNALNSNEAVALTQAQAISGLGGVGKTQIAIEYVYRYGHHYQAVLWLNASSRDALVADMVLLAALLGLEEQQEQDQGIVIRAVKRWLIEHTGWLLILDNVDDLEMVAEYLPLQGIGRVLLTTRLQALGTLAQSIEVEKMGVSEGTTFLLRRAKMLPPGAPLDSSMQEGRAQAAEIVSALDGLPLALDQAGAYIEETRCGLQGYLTLYRSRRKELLLRRGRLPVDHPEPVATTWSLSFQRVEQENKAAAELLRLFAFLSPEAIPDEMLSRGASELGPTLSAIAGDTLEINANIELLLRYSLIRRDSEGKSLSVHRLVQAVIKDGMEKGVQLLWAERAVRMVNRAFPDAEPQNWETCQRCLPHALLCSTYVEEYGLVFPEVVRLLNEAAVYLVGRAQYEQAEMLLNKAHGIRQKLMDSFNSHTASVLNARTLNNLGMLYVTQGRYQKAEPLLEEALELRQHVLGMQHPDTANSLHNRARLYFAQGRYADAEQYFQQALQIRQSLFFSEHPDIAQSLSYLADLYRRIGDYSRSESLYLRALKMLLTILGSEHPRIAETYYNLARLYRAEGAYTKAESYFLQALDIRRRVFGVDHPDVAQTLHRLAKLYHSVGKFDLAEKYGKEALDIQERKLGADHPDIAYTLAVLAKLSQEQRRYDTAKAYYQRALDIREKALGSVHPQFALLLSNLAELYLEQEKYDEAKELFGKSLDIRVRTLGAVHPHVAYNLCNLAIIESASGNLTQAEDLYRQALDIRQRTLHPTHPYIASTFYLLARLYLDMSKYEEAETLCKQALSIREEALGPEHPDVAACLELYAELLERTAREDNSISLRKRARTIREKRSHLT